MGDTKYLKDILKMVGDYAKSVSEDGLENVSLNKIKQTVKLSEEKLAKVADYFDKNSIKDKVKDTKNDNLKSSIEIDRNEFKENSNFIQAKEETSDSSYLSSLINDISPEELKKAVLYSEILGKPRCKTRRRVR